jgi:spermidine synthase
VLSEVQSSPGATHTLFDVLAASIAALAPGPRVAVLGFAAGGLIAPLRAMGFGHPLEAVDLSLDGERVFRALSAGWCGDVTVHQADAQAWLQRRRRPFDLILEDLSGDAGEGVTKPAVSLDVLPRLMAERLRPGGLAVTNVLPVPGRPWTRLLPHLAAPFGHARVLEFDDWENRLLICGAELASARAVGTRLRRHLRAIGSAEADAFVVRTL